MKKFAVLLLAALPLAARASTVHTLQGTPYTVDTLAHYGIGPGSVFTQLRYQSQASAAKHFTASVMEFDLTRASELGLDFRMHLGRDSVQYSERMSDVARRHTDENNHYFAAINGDFFITWSSTPGMLGFPNNTACSGGQMALSDNVDHDNHVDAWIMDRNFGMWCDQTVLDNKIILADNTAYQLYGVNFARRDDARLNAQDDASDILFFNEHRGLYTGTASGWKEITVALDQGEQWRINQPVRLRVTGAVSESGNRAIPRNGGVIACGPAAPLDLSTLAEGDVLTLDLGLSLPTFGGLRPDVKEVVGGDVTLLRNGQAVFEANRFINARDTEYPRTMVGYDADRTKMVWVAVDGKSSSNTGCSYPQGADLMKALGCYDAINFDGGGSTMMWTDANGILNRPSDGSERAVGNGLFAVLQRPADASVASIAFRDHVLTAPQYGLYTPVIYGYNRYGQLVDTAVQGVALSCSDELGYVADDGASVVLAGSGTHALTAEYNGATASIAVNIVPTEAVSFNVADLLVDNYHRWNIKTYATVAGELMELAPQAIDWASEDPAVAEVDDRGRVTGLADGVTTVTASVGGLQGVVNVTVECPTAQQCDLQSPLSMDSWEPTGYNVKDLALAPWGSCGFELGYTVSTNRNPRVALGTVAPMQIWSIPSAIIVDLEHQGEPTVLNATLNVTPANDKMQKIKLEGIDNGAGVSLAYDLAEIFDLEDPAVYPVSFNNLTFYLSGSGSGTFRISRLQALYPSFSGVDLPAVESDAAAPAEYYNLQGLRVQRPGAGLYIRRQGTRVSKVLLSGN